MVVLNSQSGTSSTLTEVNPEAEYTVNLNGETSTVTLAWHASQGSLNVATAEDDKIRPSNQVLCEMGGDGFDDDCLDLPKNISGMVARYTIFMKQISPEVSEGLTIAFDELPKGFTYVPGSTFSADSSITTVEPTNVGTAQDPIMKWDFNAGLGSPVLFNHGEIKQFSFDADINSSTRRYCSAIYLKPNQEFSGKVGIIDVGNPADTDGCKDGGTTISKVVDTPVAMANQSATFTYIINVKNFDTSALHLYAVRDVLPSGVFTYVAESTSYKIANEPFDPLTGDFTDVDGHTALPDTELQTSTLPSGRLQFVWSEPQGGGDPNWNLAQAKQNNNTLIIRFQVLSTLSGSGTYFNEVFADADNGCHAPNDLKSAGVFTSGFEDAEFCAYYSWPTAGIIIPNYDVKSKSGILEGQGSVVMYAGSGSADINSWNLN